MLLQIKLPQGPRLEAKPGAGATIVLPGGRMAGDPEAAVRVGVVLLRAR